MRKNKRSFTHLFKESFDNDVDSKDYLKIKYRPYQQELVQKYEEGVRFFLICWARRLGKDMFAFSIACRQALERPNSIIYYMFVTQKQGKMVLLDVMINYSDAKFQVASFRSRNLHRLALVRLSSIASIRR